MVNTVERCLLFASMAQLSNKYTFYIHKVTRGLHQYVWMILAPALIHRTYPWTCVGSCYKGFTVAGAAPTVDVDVASFQQYKYMVLRGLI
jgi:hypothetical protein